MFAGWLSKGLLAFLLTFALTGMASAQTKSADLPVPHRVNCIPVNVGQVDSIDQTPVLLSQTISDVVYATRSEIAYSSISQFLTPLFLGVEGNNPVPNSNYVSYVLTTGPWSGLFDLLR